MNLCKTNMIFYSEDSNVWVETETLLNVIYMSPESWNMNIVLHEWNSNPRCPRAVAYGATVITISTHHAI